MFHRVVVIAPTRSTCVNIHTVLSNGSIPPTLLVREKGVELSDAVAHLHEGGFGVVAGTGTGKTVAIRKICSDVLGTELLIDVVTREHEATEKTWRCNVLVVTPGVALNWLKAGRITAEDLIVIDEIHQTSEHLELSMALGKLEKEGAKTGCTFVWMSATIDPATYRGYLNARTVISCDAFDPSRRAKVEVLYAGVQEYLEGELKNIQQEQRSVAVFVPTRALAEKLSRELGGRGVHTDFYHGGESAEKLRPFLTGNVPRPFMVFMTIAGASSLNILGLDTVVIVDQWFTEVIRDGGRKSLEKLYLGDNELLQMGGRVNGRAVNGKIVILSNRQVDFHSLKPVAPQFVLGGDLENTALICARLGIDARNLDLIGKIDHKAYARVVERFRQRGLLVVNGEIHLTALGEHVEKLPVEPHWGEMLVAAEDVGDRKLFNLITVVASCGQLYQMHRKEWNRFSGVCVRGSDHLTAYNIVVQALNQFGSIRQSREGRESEYTLRGDWYRGPDNKGEFAEWCDKNGFVGKEIKNVLLSMKSIFRTLQMPLPKPEEFEVVTLDSEAHKSFVGLLAKVQSLEFVRGEQNSFAGTVWATQGGMSSTSQTLGSIRFWKDKRGYLRASMEGTEIPTDLVQKHSFKTPENLKGMIQDGDRFQISYSATFAGEKINPIERELDPDDVPEAWQSELPSHFASWLASQMV
ncbi:hypothetical protein HYV70_05130 [Candidatus Uhrbacteria bacterium]|nr:hypothetical protein [Candidatus Uhrbacteria bacterium]